MNMFKSLSGKSSSKDVVLTKDDADDGVVFTHSRGRTVSDMMSGMSIKRTSNAAYAPYTDNQLTSHFARFKQYDLDDTGYVTADNLKQIMQAMEIEVSDLQCTNMIDEVAILVGHENDGKLSFRDYCALLSYEKAKTAANEMADAEEEMHESIRESQRGSQRQEGEAAKAAGTEGGAEAAPAGVEEISEIVPGLVPGLVKQESGIEHGRMRGSSFAVLDTIALTRIQIFEQTIQEVAAKEKVNPAQVAKQSKFNSKLEKFRKIESGAEPHRVNQENMQKQTLKAKLVAFEEAAKKDPVIIKTTWKNQRPGSWAAKKQIGSGPPPKKSLTDLP
uniref:EF-hand domain-containing protein n=1 Tax=Haptolina brevifila TaxID=156173 RepID=A0A7S2JMW6_9EUKA|mmetsp:Transcript_8517/g.17263  ORF Transcript_8517/g.17263 Transcript_8517/m.17263 type:complete len:332 (+) Transcript_8517:59-1054(+)|eukprot:CAMPEP_0174737416 /NCGR_PEP_ID=MMETSP1094-20130205/68287_1 /TAXON_ID=156173 /ORGANISM="Chrysochromulina brevifilum, Strain UTEX LB 985" /LENGTH=331 /DNA_ID=CAMNT_0015940645 /DNA_START=38 /DNA_END=1033 /DNA_ORIENTATION=+